MLTINTFCQQLQSYLEPDQIQQVRRAYYFAEQAHDGQQRKSGEAYVLHPLSVASILADMGIDHQSLQAAMLHDVIEDTEITKTALANQFGCPVANLVDGVSKLTHLEFKSHAESQAHNFQKMAIAMARDIRVILVKLADRLHNMRTIGVMRAESRCRIARETTDIYAPIASRLGMHKISVELEDLAFSAYYPMRHRYIKRAVETARGKHKALIEQVQQALVNCLAQENLFGTVTGREKHLASIYNKMKIQNKSFREIMDVFAFRITTDKVDTCYRILGAVHHLNLYRPVPGRFKDYIAIPKSNGYQSLHTTLYRVGSGVQTPIEIQIRTREMDAIANYGIAEHWLYKDDDSGRSAGTHSRARQWLQGLLEMQKQSGNALEFINHVKHDLFPDEEYVFTPKGEVLALPKGSTAVDFAYAVHTQIGNSCIACKINRRLAPLSQKLESGDTVEIITTTTAKPNMSWLSFIATAKASASIRHYLKNQVNRDSVNLGRRLLNQELGSINTSLEQIDPDQLQQYLKRISIANLDDLLADIGLGKRMAYVCAHSLTKANNDTGQATNAPIAIHGTEGLLVKYSKCCNPLPGDSVVGHINSGHGIVVHRNLCKNLKELARQTDKTVSLTWAETTEGNFNVHLKVEVTANRGIIANLAASVAKNDANIDQINVNEQDASLSVVNLGLNVHNRIHLARVMKSLRRLHGVIRLTRQ